VKQLIANLIVANVVETLTGVSTAADYASTLVVKDEPADAQAITDGATYVYADDPDPVPDRAPLQHDEYDMTISVETYATQSGTLASPSIHDKVRAQVGDIFRAIRDDYTCGGYAWHVEFGAPQKIDQGGGIAGRRLSFVVSFRTLRDNPFSQ
jgi:hypothetical protein